MNQPFNDIKYFPFLIFEVFKENNREVIYYFLYNYSKEYSNRIWFRKSNNNWTLKRQNIEWYEISIGFRFSLWWENRWIYNKYHLKRKSNVL